MTNTTEHQSALEALEFPIRTLLPEPSHATRIGLLRAGKIAAAGAPDDILGPETLAGVFKVKACPIQSADGTKLFSFERTSAPTGAE